MVDQPEQPAARQVGADDPGDVVAKLGGRAVGTAQVGNRDRNWLGPSAIDVDDCGRPSAARRGRRRRLREHRDGRGGSEQIRQRRRSDRAGRRTDSELWIMPLSSTSWRFACNATIASVV